MRAEIFLFASQFAAVFLLGFQSQNIRDNHFAAASGCSVLIGIFQLFQWHTMPKATPVQMLIWLCAGPLAIVAAMWLHPKIMVDKRKSKRTSPLE